MNLFENLAGVVRVELTSANLPGALAAINAAGIEIREAEMREELTIRFTIPRRTYQKLRAMMERRGDILNLTERSGLYWDL